MSLSALPMHRRPLLDLLEVHRHRWPEDDARVTQICHFVRTHPDCFERSCAPGHITGSAWIVSADRRAVLLTHHRKLNRWLQLGGHADGDPNPLQVAQREAEEESGLAHFHLLPGPDGHHPIDLDIHAIPARGSEPEHLHYDIRFLLLAGPDQELRISDESHALRWVPWDDLGQCTTEPSIQRMAGRAQRLLRGAPTV